MLEATYPANLFLGDGRFEMRDCEMPTLAPYEVRVRNMACGVCGTDVHIYHGEPGSAEVMPPVVLGHEYAGAVVEIGAAVTTLAVGDHVTMDPNINCELCESCRNGIKQHCEHMEALGVTCDGGFAKYSIAPERQCYKLAPELPFEVGAMAEPIACCLHGIDLIAIRPGESVLVVGGGAIGLIMVQLARLCGASTVVLSEPIAARRAIGLEVGADAAVHPLRGSIADTLRAQTGVDGADVVIECVGRTAATQQSIAAAKAGGRILLFSVPALDATYPLPLFDVFKKELKIMGSFVNPRTHQRAVNLLNHGRLNIDALITHRFPLAQVEEAIHMQMSDASIKVVVLPQEE